MIWKRAEYRGNKAGYRESNTGHKERNAVYGKESPGTACFGSSPITARFDHSNGEKK